MDTDHYTTCSLLYDTQDSRSAYSTLNGHIHRRPSRISFHQLVHQLPSLEDSHTRPIKFPISLQSYLHRNLFASAEPEIERYGFSVKDRSLCDSGDARLSMRPLCSVAGRSDSVGRQVRHQVVPVATSRTTGCCNLATKAGICGSDSIPTLNLMSRSRWPGTEALISCKCADGPVHRVAQ